MKEKENRVSLPNQPMILAKDVYRQTFSPSLAYQGMLDLGSPSHNAQNLGKVAPLGAITKKTLARSSNSKQKLKDSNIIGRQQTVHLSIRPSNKERQQLFSRKQKTRQNKRPNAESTLDYQNNHNQFGDLPANQPGTSKVPGVISLNHSNDFQHDLSVDPKQNRITNESFKTKPQNQFQQHFPLPTAQGGQRKTINTGLNPQHGQKFPQIPSSTQNNFFNRKQQNNSQKQSKLVSNSPQKNFNYQEQPTGLMKQGSQNQKQFNVDIDVQNQPATQRHLQIEHQENLNLQFYDFNRSSLRSSSLQSRPEFQFNQQNMQYKSSIDFFKDPQPVPNGNSREQKLRSRCGSRQTRGTAQRPIQSISPAKYSGNGIPSVPANYERENRIVEVNEEEIYENQDLIRKKPNNVLIKNKSPRISFNGNQNVAAPQLNVANQRKQTRGGLGGSNGSDMKRRSIEINGEPQAIKELNSNHTQSTKKQANNQPQQILKGSGVGFPISATNKKWYQQEPASSNTAAVASVKNSPNFNLRKVQPTGAVGLKGSNSIINFTNGN